MTLFLSFSLSVHLNSPLARLVGLPPNQSPLGIRQMGLSDVFGHELDRTSIARGIISRLNKLKNKKREKKIR